MKEFHEHIELCIQCSDCFSESEFRKVKQTVMHYQEVNNEFFVSTTTRESHRSAEVANSTLIMEESDIIDLTVSSENDGENGNENSGESGKNDDGKNDDEIGSVNSKIDDLGHVTIDIHEELGAVNDRKKKIKLIRKPKGRVEHQFIEVTAEEIISDGPKRHRNKRKPKQNDVRSPIETRSRTSTKRVRRDHQ